MTTMAAASHSAKIWNVNYNLAMGDFRGIGKRRLYEICSLTASNQPNHQITPFFPNLDSFANILHVFVKKFSKNEIFIKMLINLGSSEVVGVA